MLVTQASEASVQTRLGSKISAVESAKESSNTKFCLRSQAGQLGCSSLVVATGGRSIPKLGATGFGYQLARHFGLPLVETRAALVPFRFTGQEGEAFNSLAGLSLPVAVSCRGAMFTEAMLFTHRGLSGPAILQISSYWNRGDVIHVNLLPGLEVEAWLRDEKQRQPRLPLRKLLANKLPRRLVSTLATLRGWRDAPLGAYSQRGLAKLAGELSDWRLRPASTEGYRSAELTRGGVHTDALSSKTMGARQLPGLYFIGEVMDVSGQLGGFNLQWAWSSGYCAGQFV